MEKLSGILVKKRNWDLLWILTEAIFLNSETTIRKLLYFLWLSLLRKSEYF